MFSDLVDSTRVAGALDPEDWREVVRAYQECCSEVVTRYDGHIAQYLGDGLLIYFGYPQSHEDDAQRAARAGLAIVEAVGKLNTRLESQHSVRLSLRVGIHTGPVVVGEMGGGERRETLALGDTTNLAARLQEVAAPDSVVVSQASLRLIQGIFIVRDLGAHSLKGIPDPVGVTQILRPSGVQSRLDVAAAAGLTPLVGREQEVGLLLDRWEQAQEGLGQVVLVSGEAGIGKSRVIQVLRERLADEPHTWLECRCSPYTQESALFPVVELLKQGLAFQLEDSPEEKLGRLERGLERAGFSSPEVVPLLAPLLELPLPEGYPPPQQTPDVWRQRTLEALRAWVLDLGSYQPLVLLVEDLHWADPSTLELLGPVFEQAPTSRILAILTYRPEFNPPWAGRSHATPIVVSRLTRRQVRAMIERIAGGPGLPEEVVGKIAARTDGVPLFVEELTKNVLESGILTQRNDGYELEEPLGELAIPETLQDSLMARLDRLGEAKELAQLGATIGREFPYGLLQAVSSLDEPPLRKRLTRLLQAELLYERGQPPSASYIFKHALIQEAAYGSLLKSRRRELHARIAEQLCQRFPETAEAQPELVARHYTEAGMNEPAIVYWHRAGQRAVARSANAEATRHLMRGLELLETLPDADERSRQELQLQITLGTAWMGTRGYTSSEVEKAFGRARELCNELGETSELFDVLFGLSVFYFLRSELRTALNLGEQLLEIAENAGDPELLLAAHSSLTQTLFFLGEIAASKAHADRGIALDTPGRTPDFRFAGAERSVVCRRFASHALLALGYPDQAMEASEDCVHRAEKLAQPLSVTMALFARAQNLALLGEYQAALDQAESVISLSRDQGFPFYLGSGMLVRGVALVGLGQHDEGIAELHQTLSGARAVGAEAFVSTILFQLAESHLRAGEADEALGLLEEVFPRLDQTEERWGESAACRMKGEALLARVPPDPDRAETAFLQALEVARRQGARMFELRAATSLALLLQEQGRTREARELLAPVYDGFTEGWNFRDAREAKALLDALR
jgi:class 3 adenylate cyclase/predicted ATPase